MDRDQPGKPPGLVASLHPPTPAGSSVLDPAVVKSQCIAFRGGVRCVGPLDGRGQRSLEACSSEVREGVAVRSPIA